MSEDHPDDAADDHLDTVDPFGRDADSVVREGAAADAAEAAAWSEAIDGRGWKALAARLDAAAAALDRPALRALADAVRFTSMTVADVAAHPGEALRVIAALDAAMAMRSPTATTGGRRSRRTRSRAAGSPASNGC